MLWLKGAFGSVPTTPTRILLRKYHDTTGSRIVIHVGGAKKTSKRAYFCRSIAIEMGGVLRYFSKSIGVRGRCDSCDQFKHAEGFIYV